MTAALGSAGGRASGSGSLAALRMRFPNWRAWHSDAGRCWATRVGGRPAGRSRGSWAMTLDGDTPDQLAQAIEAEEAHARSGP